MHLTLTQVCEAVISATRIRFMGRDIDMENSERYKVGGIYYASLDEAEQAIKDSYRSLAKSIVKP